MEAHEGIRDVSGVMIEWLVTAVLKYCYCYTFHVLKFRGEAHDNFPPISSLLVLTGSVISIDTAFMAKSFLTFYNDEPITLDYN